MNDYWEDCKCGHGRNDHFDETRVCSECECERYRKREKINGKSVDVPKITSSVCPVREESLQHAGAAHYLVFSRGKKKWVCQYCGKTAQDLEVEVQ